MKKKIRVVQYGVGPIGAAIIRLAREKQAVEVLGGIDRDPAKAGKDLGEITGSPDAPWGVQVAPSPLQFLGDADVVLHSTSSLLPEVMPQLIECLEAGVSVISTCEELAYPFRKHPGLSKKLDQVARDSGAAVLGTGVNPGFVLDKMVLTLAAVAQRVSYARALRIVDASKRRLPLQKKIGAGMTVEEFREQVAAGTIKHHGLPESLAMVAAGLGFAVDDITETIEPVVAAEQVVTPFLTVEPGQAAGVHQIARGTAGGKELVNLELQMYVGAKEPGDWLDLKGDPDLSLVIPGGTHGDLATAAVVVNAIPVILNANAGLRTAADLPFGYFAASAGV